MYDTKMTFNEVITLDALTEHTTIINETLTS